MSTESPRLRSKYKDQPRPWPVGQIPDTAIYELSKQLVYRIALGDSDLDGNSFSAMFAEIVGGEFRRQNLGLSDVFANGNAWSAKTVKNNNPWKAENARLISGRNSPSYSFGITDPFSDIQETGKAVLEIWNARVREALSEFDEIRAAVLIRNMQAKEFCFFENPVNIYTPQDFVWELNRKNNFEGFEKSTRRRCFTWQHHGGQFTIHRIVPGSAKHFRISKEIPLVVEFRRVLENINYNKSWVEIR